MIKATVLEAWFKKRWICCRITPQKSEGEIDREKVREIFYGATGFRMSKNKVENISESLKIKAVTTPKILIKDHKTFTRKGDFSTRLVIPSINLSATFEKMGSLVLENVL